MAVAERLVASPTLAPARLQGIGPAEREDERLARLQLARSENVGPRTYLHLLGRFGSAEGAMRALPELAARGGHRSYRACELDVAAAEVATGEAGGARLVTLGDPDYPAKLAQIENPPPVLWTRGTTAIGARDAVAVVGARNASALGQRMARRLATDLGAAGYATVSGLARGIDAAVHEASLESGTIAVLAGGIDRIYPPEHHTLADRILASGGMLVTECPVGLEPTARHFPRRNRLISGLADGVVLIEAAMRSGSLITARHALEQGRDVMACPGAPEDPRAGGCNQLIRDGAALVRSAEDVIEALAGPQRIGFAEDGTDFLFDANGFNDETMIDEELGLEEFKESDRKAAFAEEVFALLTAHPVDIDELSRASGASMADLSLALLELDLAGRVDIIPGGQVALADGAFGAAS
ncbi:MAG: DNA-processing protein DprA [Pseudomonadota bacterium]